LALFADNNTGNISEQDLRDFVCSIYDAVGSSADELVKGSADDTTANYLENKIVAGSNIAVTVLNPGGNETVQIAATGVITSDELVKVSADDTTAGRLEDKIVAGTNITVTTLTPGGNETFEISASGGGGGTVQGTDGTYDIQATNDGAIDGNARGENSVDLQTIRSAATQVAGSPNTVICGGRDNIVASTFANGSAIGGGFSNYCNGYYTTVSGGYDNLAYGYYSAVVGGQSNESNGQWSVVGGYNCTIAASANGSVAMGETVSVTGATSVGLGSNSSVTGDFSFGTGFATRVAGDYAFGLCRGTTPIGSTTSYVDGNHAFGMGNAVTISSTGTYAHAQGLTVACTGARSFAHGSSLTCSDIGAVTFGLTNTLSGRYCFATGINHTIGGFGHYATCIGSATDTDIAAAFVHGGGRIAAGASNDGSAQAVQYIVHGITTDATQTELLTTDGGGSRRLELPDDATWSFDILVTARRTDVNDESAMYHFLGCIDRNTGVATTTLVGTPIKTEIEDTAAWDVEVDADTTNGALRIRVTGEALKTIRWVAVARTTQTFG
jgi:hypothetical protein